MADGIESGATFSVRYRAMRRVNREVDERFLNGKCNKKQIQETHLQVERFLIFVKTGNVKLPNLLKGCHQVITPSYQKIVDAFLARQDMRPNTRNDARRIAYMGK